MYSPPPPHRFCDTNTTVNLKCLDFLSSLFALLIKGKYRMSDFEAAAFLPFLVIKVPTLAGEDDDIWLQKSSAFVVCSSCSVCI